MSMTDPGGSERSTGDPLAAGGAVAMSESWTESYPAMEFRHGPIGVVGPASTVWVFGPPPPGLLEDLQQTEANVESSGLDPMADLIRAQRLAVALAEAKRLNPDEPRHLTRSVLLP